MLPKQVTENFASTENHLVASRMDYIDTLRGFACLWVLLHHSIGRFPVEAGTAHLPLRILVAVADLGWLGVSLFLVLSGFCLYYPLVRRNQPAHIRLNLRDFARRRALRILPPYYMTLGGVVVVTLLKSFLHKDFSLEGVGGVKSIVLHLLMLHNLDTATIGAIVPAFWSLALESQLYVLFPVMVWLIARRGLMAPLIVTFCVAVVWQTAVYSRLGFFPDWLPKFATWYHALPGRCFEFAAGMVTAAIVASPQLKFSRPAAVTALLLLFPAVWYALFVSRFGPLLDQLWGIIFCCLIVLLNQIPAHVFRNSRVLSSLTWIGTISYSLYLIHQPFFKVVPLLSGNDSSLIFSTCVRMLVAVAVAYLFFLAFERPFIVRRKATTNEMIQATALSPAP